MESEVDTVVVKGKPSRRSKLAPQAARDRNQENIDDYPGTGSGSSDAHMAADEKRSSTPTSGNSSSTPRRKKGPLANLHSNLSPKYIGFVTPTSNLDNSTEERTRKTRRRHNAADTSLMKDDFTEETGDMSGQQQLFGSHDTSVGYVRRTPKETNVTPDHKNGRRKEFVSPIDKLLKKNGSLVDSDKLPLDDNCNVDGEQQLQFYTDSSRWVPEERQYEVVMNYLEDLSHDEEADALELNNNYSQKIEDVATGTARDIKINGKQNADTASENGYSTDGVDKEDVPREITEKIVSNQEILDDSDDVYATDSEDQLEAPIRKASGVDKSIAPIIAENGCLSDPKADMEPTNANDVISQQSDVDKGNPEPDEDLKDVAETSMTKKNTYTDSYSSKSAEDNECTSESDNGVVGENHLKFKLPTDNHQNKEMGVHIVRDVQIEAQMHMQSADTSPDFTEATEQKKDVRIEIDTADTESNSDFVVDATSAKSPSAISMDSAKGSSILNEGSWMSFSTGDLFWGQIYNYCYWPCMVCPDPQGKTITTKEHISGDQHVMVHVRFFADNARRNWVRRENLMPFTTLEQYQERLEECREKHGAKSAKCRIFVPKNKKVSVWYDAIDEANMVAEVPYEGRLEKFYEIFEKSRLFQKTEKQRRKSMYLPGRLMSASDGESLYGSQENVNNLAVSLKRERSTSPFSPAYSPIKTVSVKKRKLSTEKDLPTTSAAAVVSTPTTDAPSYHEQQESHQMDSSNSSSTKCLHDLDIFNSSDFKTLYLAMKDFVLEGNPDEKLDKSLLVAVRNIWALKQLSHQQMLRKLSDSSNEIDSGVGGNDSDSGGITRLSNRLRSLMARKSLVSQRSSIDLTNDVSITPKQAKDASISSTVIAEKPKKPVNRPILEVIDDIFELDNKYLFKGMGRDPVCKYCFKPGSNLRRCSKNCHCWLHAECLHKSFSLNGKLKKNRKRALKSVADYTVENNNNNSTADLTVVDSTDSPSTVPHVTAETETKLICKECANNESSKCMVCNLTDSGKPNNPLVKCSMSHCDRAFHPACCKYWPQSKITISKNHIQSFRCPSHVCHTCVSDDPKGKFQQLSSTKTTKCVKCPATFHTDSTCIPAGSQILTAAHIICPRHASLKLDMTINVNWCFICVGGGQVVCCETCPTAVHAQCLKIPIDPNEGYICEECESGRMPLYGEMVWAKFTRFRWWPAIILPPTEIPQNIARRPHNPSDFVVRFFGTNDHGWISRRRVYLYLEGDSSEPPKWKTSALDVSYTRGLTEAKEVYKIVKGKKLLQRTLNENKQKLHPQPYVRIKANRAVPPVKLHIDIESVSKCECNPNDVNPCGPETNCLNRVLYHECNPKVCPARERCQNQMFESRISPLLDVIYMKERGFGLMSRENIPAGSFVIEYVGEIINDDEFRARMAQKSLDRDENFYFLSVEKDYIIDAGPKGNLARFMNHSCDPNCETQKWSVNSLNRVGLFAIKDIPENTELTFNYHWDDLLGNEKKTCYCGSTKCSGQIGGKIREIESKEPSPSSDVAVKQKGKTKTKSKGKPLKRLHTKTTVGKLKPLPKHKGNAAKLKRNKIATALTAAASKPVATPKPTDKTAKESSSSHTSVPAEDELLC